MQYRNDGSREEYQIQNQFTAYLQVALRRGNPACMQMLQHMNIGILQRGGYCRTKKVVGNQTADQSGFVIGVLHDTPPLDVGVKQTGV